MAVKVGATRKKVAGVLCRFEKQPEKVRNTHTHTHTHMDQNPQHWCVYFFRTHWYAPKTKRPVQNAVVSGLIKRSFTCDDHGGKARKDDNFPLASTNMEPCRGPGLDDSPFLAAFGEPQNQLI